MIQIEKFMLVSVLWTALAANALAAVYRQPNGWTVGLFAVAVTALARHWREADEPETAQPSVERVFVGEAP